MIRGFKLVHLIVHVVVFKDLLQAIFVFVAIIQCHGNTLCSKATRSSNSMQIIFGIANSLASLSINSLSWYVKINDNLDFRNIDTTCKQICSDNYTDFT